MKVALVHDYLKEYGGAERVLMALHEIYPEAPVYTIFYKKDSDVFRVFRDVGGIRVVESWFGKLPFCDKLISPLRFLIPLIWGSFNFSDYDLVISSASWAVTKGFTGDGVKGVVRGKVKGEVRKRTKEICYCHTPPRYLYGYETSRNWKKHWYIRLYATVVNHFMRIYDFEQAQKVTWFIANSKEVQQRIKKFYRRDSVVINPPVEIPTKVKSQKSKVKSKENYYLTGGRLEAAKNFDLIIKVCNELKISLKIYGSGSQEKNLRLMAGPTIEFLGRISEEEKFRLMAEAKAFIAMATDEDFGITPVEAMAVGTPVIAYKGGGYLETVVEGPPSSSQTQLWRGEGKTGVFVGEATVGGLIRAVRDFGDVGGEIKPEDCRKQAEKFSKERFKKEIEGFIRGKLKE